MINKSLSRFKIFSIIMKKWIKISIVVVCILLLWAWFIYWDQTRCYEIQKRCSTIYDLSTIENLEDIDFYRWLNEKCLGKCWTPALRLKFRKRWCRYQYKEYKERTKDRRYFKPDTYNPCPELYTLPELNNWLREQG